MFVNLDISSASNATIVTDFYGLPNGGDFLTDGVFFNLSGAATITTGCGVQPVCAGVEDGIFSIGVHLISGSADLSDAFAFADDANANRTSNVFGTLATTSAPEPATLALLGVGLAGLGFSRRQRKQ